jgi:hypothetical protein
VTDFVTSALVNLIFCEKISLRYDLRDSFTVSTGCDRNASSFTVAPAPVGVALAETTPALMSALKRSAILFVGAEDADADVEAVCNPRTEDASTDSLFNDWEGSWV